METGWQIFARKRVSQDEDTCSDAAKNGHNECLKYAHENGCLSSEYVHRLLPAQTDKRRKEDFCLFEFSQKRKSFIRFLLS